MATISRRGHITDAEEAGGQSSHCHLGNSVKQSARLKYYTCGYNKDGAGNQHKADILKRYEYNFKNNNAVNICFLRT